MLSERDADILAALKDGSRDVTGRIARSVYDRPDTADLDQSKGKYVRERLKKMQEEGYVSRVGAPQWALWEITTEGEEALEAYEHLQRKRQVAETGD